MVLGAGLGTRLKPFTAQLPKSLIPVMGVACIDYSLSLLQSARVKEAVINVHAHPQKMNQHLSKLSAKLSGMKLTVSDESSKLLGSAGGLRHALANFNQGAFFALNSDVICGIDLRALEKRHHELRKKHGVVMTMAIACGNVVQQQTGQYRELFLNESSGLISGFGTVKKHVPFYTGVAVFEPEAFAHLNDNEEAEFVPQVLEPWIKKNKVGFFNFDGAWLDIGTPELWWKAHDELKTSVMLENAPVLPNSWQEQIRKALQEGKVELDQPWSGWVRYGKTPTPEKLLGKRGIQLDNLIYELPV